MNGPVKYSPEWYERKDERDAAASDLESARAAKRAFRKALRNYRRHVIPLADEPCSLIDSWPFLVCGLVIAIALLCANAWGMLP